jgi:hypothetical protein
MSYSTDHLRTAGKITVYTTLLGVFVFAVVFVFNIGTTEIKDAGAQEVATTSVTIVNTPPFFTVEAIESPASATTSPTNVGDDVTWVATADDANDEPYYLLICDDNATPTANSGAAPECDPGAIQWAVSVATTSANTQATVSTTTTAVAPFNGEAFDWFAWVCDDNAVTPRCSATSTQGAFGPNATSSSPFEINHRPSFSFFVEGDPSGYDPGATAIFYSTSSDTDTSGSQDTVRLFVCSTNSFNIATDECDVTTLASTTAPGPTADATATYAIPIPLIDQDYGAWGFVIDNHGFEAVGGAQCTDTTLTINNVAPTVASSSISLVQPLVTNLVITNAATETPGFVLEFTADDHNTCLNSVAGDEIVDYELSIYRSGVGSTTCTTAAGDYDANNCYPSGVATQVWNLSCTASTTSCSGGSDTDQIWNCTFPLWYIADPTDGNPATTQYPTEDWRAQVQAIDDDALSGPLSESETGVDVTSLLAFALNTPTIPYGALEPGQQTDPLVATTTLAATGNVGLDKIASGTAMCTNYATGDPCQNSASSTIPAEEQRFATGTVAYADATALSSTTGQEIEINVFKSTSTSTPAEADAYWGIRIPATITFAGDYTGENVFFAVVGEPDDWD